MSPPKNSPPVLVPIGVVARRTGIPVETLRTWERRYGVPSPERDESGRRAYSVETIEHVQLVAKAIQAGERASRALRLPSQALRALLDQESEQGRQEIVEQRAQRDADDVVAHWVELAHDLNGDQLEAAFRSAWAELGGVRFVVERAGPFVEALGDAWVNGTVGVHHEHFASERLRDFLVSTWRPMANSATGPMVVCTTLPGEHHGLGLHMVAAVAVIAGLKLTFLGSDSPLPSIARTVEQTNARAVLLSISGISRNITVREALHTLRQLVPDSTDIVVGGAGAPAMVDGVITLDSLYDLLTWARGIAQTRSTSER